MDVKRFTRGIDTKLVGALVLLVIVTTICAVALERQRQNGLLVRSLSSTTDEVAALRAENDELRRQVASVAASQSALLAYLRKHGIAVPEKVVTPPPEPEKGTASVPKAHGPRGPKPKPRHPHSPTTPPASPGHIGSTPTPTPTPGVLDPVCELVPALCPLI